MSKKRDQKLQELALNIANHQANIVRLGEKWAAQITENLDATELKLLREIKSFLKGHPDGMITFRDFDDMAKLEKKIANIRRIAFQKSYDSTKEEAQELSLNEQKWAHRVTKEIAPETAGKMHLLPDNELQKKTFRSYINGSTFEEWFRHTAESDLQRIINMVRTGVMEGYTVSQMVKKIMGTKAGNYEDGILHTTRKQATAMARTLCGGISNQAKDQFYRDNDDVVIGVEWLDTLDGRTCPHCAGLSRKRWKTNDPHPVPPLHPNCRCVLLPVTEITDMGEDIPRPAANADFMALAKEEYEKKYPGKKWEDLAESTRKSKYYKAMKDFEDRTGKPAYSQVPGNMKFKDYFLQMDEKQKSSWLGKRKYEMWKDGLVDLDKFVPPYPDRAFTVRELKERDKKSF